MEFKESHGLRRCGILPHPVDAASSPRPPCLRPGVTLVELMIAMLILAIVCVAWLEIIGIQSARREARRREAVERLAGMMDAFMAVYTNPNQIKIASYHLNTDKNVGLYENDQDLMTGQYVLEFVKDDTNDALHYVFNSNISPIRYQLRVETANSLLSTDQAKGWRQANNNSYPCSWLVGRLYDKADDEQPFFILPICLGFPVTQL